MASVRSTRSSDPPVPLSEVLRAEHSALRPAGDPTPLRALCISGGGIRSATFALGAMQCLAELGLLQQFDYLSTVSGGGYIGSWLTAWIQRAGSLNRILPNLSPHADQAEPVEHLRAYNNYLTPRLGALSADTWTLACTIARNVFLNWLVFLPLLLAALMLPRLVLAASRSALRLSPLDAGMLAVAAALLLIVSLINILRFLPGVGGVNHTTRIFITHALSPLVLAAVLLSSFESLGVIAFWPTLISTLTVCLLAWALYALAALGRFRLRQVRELFALGGAVLVLGCGIGAAAWLVQSPYLTASWPLQITFAPPLLLLGFATAGAIFVGLSSHTLGTQDREWMARAAAYVAIVCALWLGGFILVLLAPGWLLSFPHLYSWRRPIIAVLTVVSGWTSSLLGYHAPTSPAPNANAPPPRPSGSLAGMALKVAPALFITLLAITLALATDWLLIATGASTFTDHAALLLATDFTHTLGWSVGFLALAWFMARFININKFSLQGMYRDRLIRAYLGASNPTNDANHFTGFSTTDDMPLGSLDPTLRPFPVLNLTLNLVASKNLAWQQRKAEPFTASPLHCGSPALGYRPSSGYGGSGGITLGTAAAISGAAASPNMGYHSSPLVGFIMTLFNVRLGAWLGNPGPAGAKTWTLAGPRSATHSLLREALGLTTDCSANVYLSDGGHFENLGLYEMVRRRCKTILVLDGGCDPEFSFEDLGNALRKIRIDLNVPIEFALESQAALRARNKRWAVARIAYSAADAGETDGDLIYIKPMLLGSEPSDVASYAAAHPGFPHQSTAEQWFDESQTESYRMLGLTTIAELGRACSAPETLEQIARILTRDPMVETAMDA